MRFNCGVILQTVLTLLMDLKNTIFGQFYWLQIYIKSNITATRSRIKFLRPQIPKRQNYENILILHS